MPSDDTFSNSKNGKKPTDEVNEDPTSHSVGTENQASSIPSDKRFRTLFEQSPLSVQLLSVDGRTLQVNRAWKNLWGFPEDFIRDVILKSYNMLEDPELKKKGILEFVRDGFRGKGGKIPPIFYDVSPLNEQGRGRWVEGHIEPIFNEEGRVQEVMLIHQDVTDQVHFQKELKAAKDAAEEANRLKSAFLTNMSHEIRTPLGAILGFTELLRDPALSDEEFTEFLEIIDRSGQSLTKIIDDILDLSKVEAGRLKIETLTLNTESLITEVLALFKNQAAQRGLKLQLINHIDASLPIQTDPARLRQILINLVGNALKFTGTGGVEIKAETFEANQAAQLKISVSDTGFGIAQAQQTELFQPFYQVDSSRTRSFEGTGLGLVLSRRLAEAMGGNVYLEKSTPGEGSIFVVTLPFKGQTENS